MQVYANLSIRLLVHLVQDYPLLLGPITPPAVAPALGQFMSCNSPALQESCLHAAAMLIRLLPRECSMCSMLLQYGLWCLNAVCDGVIGIQKGIDTQGRHAAAAECIEAAVGALQDVNLLPLYANR